MGVPDDVAVEVGVGVGVSVGPGVGVGVLTGEDELPLNVILGLTLYSLVTVKPLVVS